MIIVLNESTTTFSNDSTVYHNNLANLTADFLYNHDSNVTEIDALHGEGSSLSEGEHGGHGSSETCTASHTCASGLLLPAWKPPVEELGDGAKVYRAIIYLLALAYLLFGVNIITDRMLSCIEVIVAQKRTIRVKTKCGETHVIKVPVWHPVVATLTVFVIGASAAEIFLPTIEMAKHHFVAHDLGPSLIFGSGAYHLFIITGLCLSSVKETAGKPIQDLRVFFVTAAFAIFAYLWMFFLVDLISPGEITISEAVVTLGLFPLLVFTAWFVEKRLDKVIRKRFLQCTGLVAPTASNNDGEHGDDILDVASGTMLEVERRRRLAELLKELKTAHPNKSEIELEEMAQVQMLENIPKGAGFYRMQASKAMSGGGHVISKDKIKKRLEHEQKLKEEHDRENAINPNAQLVGFEQSNYTCMESCVLMVATVKRSGTGVNETSLLIDYETREDTALAGSDYEETIGTLEFAPGVLTADVVVKIVDDDEFEEDKDFKIVLKNPRFQNKRAKMSIQDPSAEEIILTQKETTVRILDDDHCGVFHFETADIAVPDNIGTAKIKVNRSTGARGRVQIPYKVIEGSAHEGKDYTLSEKSTLIFENDQPEAFIEITICDANRVGEIFTFFVELGEPIILSQPPQNPLGNPVLGEQTKIKVGICEDNELAEALDRLLRLGDIADLISATSWKDQFVDAFAMESSSDHNEGEDEEDEESKSVSHSSSNVDPKTCAKLRDFCCGSVKRYVVYSLSLPWKLISATIPPARYLHGWLAFILLLVLMAFLAALIGDLATAFGCTVGLKDTVTAVTLISFGMSLPDTFASRHAAMHEKTADAAIGHITGSNAVNVFLGIGLSWTTAACYHAYYGGKFTMPHTNMGYIVAVYCGLATLALITLLIRRLPPIRGELGGPRVIKYVSAAFFLLLWVTFVLLLTLQSYCVINASF